MRVGGLHVAFTTPGPALMLAAPGTPFCVRFAHTSSPFLSLPASARGRFGATPFAPRKMKQLGRGQFL